MQSITWLQLYARSVNIKNFDTCDCWLGLDVCLLLLINNFDPVKLFIEEIVLTGLNPYETGKLGILRSYCVDKVRRTIWLKSVSHQKSSIGSRFETFKISKLSTAQTKALCAA